MTKNNKQNDNTSEQKKLVTFYIEDRLFGLDATKVLLIGHDIKAITPLALEQQGLFGTIKLETRMLPVIDVAHFIGLQSLTDEKKGLLNQFKMVQQGYQDWIQELERKITRKEQITRSDLILNANLLKLDTEGALRNNDLQQLEKALAMPKQALITTCELLISLTSQHEWQQAENSLEQQKRQSLTRINNAFISAQTELEASVKQALLYMTQDGTTPYLALLVDQVNDVLAYPNVGFKSCDTEQKDELKFDIQKLDGFYMSDGLPDCYYLTCDKLFAADQQLVSA